MWQGTLSWMSQVHRFSDKRSPFSYLFASSERNLALYTTFVKLDISKGLRIERIVNRCKVGYSHVWIRFWTIVVVSKLLPRTSVVWPRFISRDRRIHTDKQHVLVPQSAFGSSLIFYFCKPRISSFTAVSEFILGVAVGKLVEALRYKPVGHGFRFRWGHWDFSLTQSFRQLFGPEVDSVANRKMSTRDIFWRVKTAFA
jgi:hypothetical protein